MKLIPRRSHAGRTSSRPQRRAGCTRSARSRTDAPSARSPRPRPPPAASPRSSSTRSGGPCPRRSSSTSSRACPRSASGRPARAAGRRRSGRCRGAGGSRRTRDGPSGGRRPSSRPAGSASRTSRRPRPRRAALQRPAEELLGCRVAVEVCRVEQGRADLEGGVDHLARSAPRRSDVRSCCSRSRTGARGSTRSSASPWSPILPGEPGGGQSAARLRDLARVEEAEQVRVGEGLHDASMMFSLTPTVVQERSPFDVSIRTRTTAPVPWVSARTRTR